LFPCTKFQIPLSVWGMFSSFVVTAKPAAKQMMEVEDVHVLAASRMNPMRTCSCKSRFGKVQGINWLHQRFMRQAFD
jgi:hypothetical protein